MTPDNEKMLTQLFEGKTIRVIDQGQETWIPLADLATAWGIDRSTPDKIIERNGKAFYGLSATVLDTTSTPMKCLNERGLYLMMGRIEARRLKNKDAQDTIIRFQQWFPELIQKFRKKELVQTTLVTQSALDILNEQLDIADSIIKRTGVDKAQAHAFAIVLAGDKAGMDLQCYATYIKAQAKQEQLLLREILPTDKEDYDKYFSLTQIAGFLKLPTDKVRNVLESLNLIYYENQMWHLTRQGEKYGKVFMITPSYPYRMNQKPYIKYNPLALDILRKYYDVEVPVTKVKE